MRKEYVQVTSRRQARKMCPWAAVIVEVDGGYLCFESQADYATWRKQK